MLQRKKNTDLPNLHHVIIAQSGTGKSAWLKERSELRKAKRIIRFDTDEEYPGEHVYSMAALIDRLEAAGKGPLDLNVTVTPTPENFELFLRVLKAYASADRITHVLLEEMSSYVPKQFDSEHWQWLWTGSRKYGLIIYGVTHSPVNVDSLGFRQAAFKWISGLVQPSDYKRVSEWTQIPVDDLQGLGIQNARGGKVNHFLYGSRADGFKRDKMRLR